ncbi:unnamed protein product [Boreogadus saida]
MPRHSTRLLALGYYGEKISYRETAVKVFRRRRSSHGPRAGRTITRASRALQLDSSYGSEDKMEFQGTSRSPPSQSHGNGANDRPTENRALFYSQMTLILLLIFGLRFMMTSQTHSGSASEGFNTEAEEFMTEILQDFEIQQQNVVSTMENRFQTKMLQIEAETDNSLGILQRKQLYLEQGVVQLWARLADHGRSLNKMQVDLNTWIGDFNKTLSQGSITTELQDILDQWFQEKLGQRSGHPLADEMADFALESQGGRVLRHLCSPSYLPKSSILLSLTSCFSRRSPRTVIQGQPELLPGQCWAFAGGTGHMVISLSHPINISHVTLDHIALHKTPTGRIDSAPKNILVYGMSDCEQNTEGTLLGNFVYDGEGKPSQTFTLHGGDKGVFRLVKLLVQTNWGHPDYTCLYRFRVHGKINSH